MVKHVRKIERKQSIKVKLKFTRSNPSHLDQLTRVRRWGQWSTMELATRLESSDGVQPRIESSWWDGRSIQLAAKPYFVITLIRRDERGNCSPLML